MAHFAQLDENNTVTQIIVVHNNELASGSEIEVVDGMIQEKQVLSETQGVSFLQGLYGSDTRWVQTSYNGNFRGKYAAIGIPALTSADIQALTSEQISGLE